MSVQLVYIRTFSSKGSVDYHPSCEECKEGRRRIDVNRILQLESFNYLSGYGFRIRFRIPDSGFSIRPFWGFSAVRCSGAPRFSTLHAQINRFRTKRSAFSPGSCDTRSRVMFLQEDCKCFCVINVIKSIDKHSFLRKTGCEIYEFTASN